jgi:hypothetical protein
MMPMMTGIQLAEELGRRGDELSTAVRQLLDA